MEDPANQECIPIRTNPKSAKQFNCVTITAIYLTDNQTWTEKEYPDCNGTKAK